MLSQLPNRTYKTFSILIALFISYTLLKIFFGDVSDTLWSQKLSHFSHSGIRDGALDHIFNKTLGFEHVYAIGLKERTDKRDFLTVSAAVSGFEVEWLDGVRPSEIQQKALPKGYNFSLTDPNAIGCWRAHMNALNNILINSYSTALVLEDDADWDVNIKSQLREFARGLHSLKGSKPHKQTPYGNNWDLLWIGGCATGPDKNETRYYAIPDDPTVPSVKNRGTWSGPLDSWKQIFSTDSTRFIYRAKEGCCTYGYAVSNRGARKILTALAIDHIEAPVDNAMSELCGGLGDRQRIECFAPFPNLIGTYRPAGPAYKDSDIAAGADQTMHDEVAHNLVYSTRRNIHRLISDQETVLSQWGSDSPWSPPEISRKEFAYPRGYLVN